jgi:hypothetical protein
MRRVLDGRALGWLERRSPGGSATGFAAAGWDQSVWVPHAMYETDDLPGGVSHDDERRMEEAAGISNVPVDQPVLAEINSRATLTGGGLGWSEHPGPGWRRLPWGELGVRLGIDPFTQFGDGHPFPYRSWPVNIDPPTEGSLDREQYRRLIEHLDAATPGADSSCFAFYSMLTANALLDVEDADALGGAALYRGLTSDLGYFCDQEEFGGSPSNIWSDNGSWLVYTDWDFQATKVSGNADLIQRLVGDPEIEAVVASS